MNDAVDAMGLDMGSARFDFSGKVALITGGGTGIGRGIAEAFAQAGGTAVITGRRLEKLEDVRAASAGHAGPIDIVQMDVLRADDRRRALEAVIGRHGRLDVLVNNALSVVASPFGELAAEDITSMYDTLLTAPTLLTQAALPHLLETRGLVLNISSIAAKYIAYPGGGLSVYSAAKAAVSQLTRALGSELAPLGVRVNAIAPGITRSESSDKAAAAAASLARATPMGRIGEPADIAAVALFLMSGAAGWVTGQVIDASGGYGLSG